MRAAEIQRGMGERKRSNKRSLVRRAAPTGQALDSLTLGIARKSAATLTHFRYGGGIANVAFLDGHVATRKEVAVPMPDGWSVAFHETRQKHRLGFLANSETPYKGRR